MTMSSKDFQDRLIGIMAGAILAYVLFVFGYGVWSAFSKAADSGPMHSPSEWRKK